MYAYTCVYIYIYVYVYVYVYAYVYIHIHIHIYLCINTVCTKPYQDPYKALYGPLSPPHSLVPDLTIAAPVKLLEGRRELGQLGGRNLQKPGVFP